MTMIHEFTPDEKRLVLAAQQRLNQTLAFIAELHSLSGNLSISPDGNGFVETGAAINPRP